MYLTCYIDENIKLIRDTKAIMFKLVVSAQSKSDSLDRGLNKIC